jgi:ethanolamine utilization protein EutA (predicted chaperonin)
VALIASAGSNSWGSLAGSTLTGVGVALVVVVVVVLDDDDVAVDGVLVWPEALSSLLLDRTNDATATMIATTTAPPMRYTVRLLLRGGTG